MTVYLVAVKGVKNFSKNFANFCSHAPDFENFSIFATNNNKFKVTFMESFLINRDHPPLNKNKQSLSLELFDR